MKEESKGDFDGNNVDLDTIKNLIIEQETLLTTYTDQWELLYTDLASCVKIMIALERKGEGQATQTLREDLGKANNQLK